MCGRLNLPASQSTLYKVPAFTLQVLVNGIKTDDVFFCLGNRWYHRNKHALNCRQFPNIMRDGDCFLTICGLSRTLWSLRRGGGDWLPASIQWTKSLKSSQNKLRVATESGTQSMMLIVIACNCAGHVSGSNMNTKSFFRLTCLVTAASTNHGQRCLDRSTVGSYQLVTNNVRWPKLFNTLQIAALNLRCNTHTHSEWKS